MWQQPYHSLVRVHDVMFLQLLKLQSACEQLGFMTSPAGQHSAAFVGVYATCNPLLTCLDNRTSCSTLTASYSWRVQRFYIVRAIPLLAVLR